MADDPRPFTNARTVTVEVNGQQEELIRRLVGEDAQGRTAADIIRQGFAEFAKFKLETQG